MCDLTLHDIKLLRDGTDIDKLDTAQWAALQL